MSSARTRLFQTEAFRLTAIYVGLFLGSMLFLIVLIYLIVSQAFEADLLHDSRDDLAAIRQAYRIAKPKKALHEAKEMIDDRLLASDPDDLFLLQNGRRKIAGNLPVMTAAPGTRRFSYARPANASADASGDLIGDGEYVAPGIYAFVGRDLYFARRAEDEVLVAFAPIFLITLVFAVAGGMLVSRSFVRRIDVITITCRAIMAGRLADRIPTRKTRNELDQLGTTINDMLDRIGVLMESVKQVSSDIAHDLRTPLTHLRYRLERARTMAAGTDQYASAIEFAIADCDELIAMFGALLRISQIEAGARRAGMQAIDVGEILRNVVTLYGPAFDDSHHPFEHDIGTALVLNGDPQLLFRLFSNLLDNAIRHTPAGTRIALRAARQGERIEVAISDQGDGIPAEERGKVFRRFYRREQSRTTPGSGLGLALVAAIAELHGATIALHDNAPGLCVMMEFSVADQTVLPRAAE